MKKSPKRKIYLDLVRILACFLVIFNHFDYGFMSFADKQVGSLSYIICLLCSIFCKCAVPLFFMISGALLLRKDDDLKTIYTKRIPKILGTLIFASAVYLVFRRFVLGDTVTISDFFLRETSFHLWYLYSYIAFLMILPLLRPVAKALDGKLGAYCLLIYLILRALPMLDFICFRGEAGLNFHLRDSILACDIFVLPLMGYYIDRRIKVKNIARYQITVLWLINFGLMFCSLGATAILQSRSLYNMDNTQRFLSSFATFNAFCILLSAKYFCKKPGHIKFSKTVRQKLIKLSSWTLGIYLWHMLPMYIILRLACVRQIFFAQNSCVQLLLWFACSIAVFIISLAGTRLLEWAQKCLKKHP